MSKKNAIKGKLPDVTVSNWGGLNTAIKNTDVLPLGTSPDSLNWMTGASEVGGKMIADHIELRRGTAFLRGNKLITSDKITGIGVGIKKDGTEIPIFTVGRKIYYYDSILNDYVEIGTDILPVVAKNDDVSIIPYQNLSGYHILISSSNSSLFRIVLSSITSIIDYNSFEFKGNIISNLGRIFLWNRKGKVQKDSINAYVSYGDASTYSSNSILIKNKVVGPATDGITKTFSSTLAVDTYCNLFGIQIVAPILPVVNISGITKDVAGVVTTATDHGLSIGDTFIITGVVGMTEINNLIGYVMSVIGSNQVSISIDTSSFTVYSSGGTIGKCEQFSDDQNGNMVSDKSGTGTINYVTGVYSITFNTAPVAGQNLILSAYEEKPVTQGIANFSTLAPTLANQAAFYQQQGYGDLKTILSFNGEYFCIHKTGTYDLTLPSNDTTKAYQNTYRVNLGIPNRKAAITGGEGIIYLDTLNNVYPQLGTLKVQYASNGVSMLVPNVISEQLDLTSNEFDETVVYEWGDFYILECKSLKNGVPVSNNDTMFVYNKKTGYYGRLDFRANMFESYYGALLAGDSISGDPLILFSGWDDLGYNINNYWKSPYSFLGAVGLKSFNRFVIKGKIQPSQNLNIYLSLDNSQYVLYDSVKGDSIYVNQGIPLEIGGPTLGSNIIGGGGTEFAYAYEAEFKIASDRFNRISVMFKAETAVDSNGQQIDGTGVGYVSVDEFTFKDIRYKSGHILPTNTQ